MRWLRSSPTVLKETPVLVIDDEADQASLNTGSVEDRSTINQLILDLLQSLPRSAYVGYTATPFANVLSDPSFPHGLYPKDFIVDLPRPDAYFGAERIFGTEPIDHDSDEDDSLNMLRTIPETELERLKPRSRDTRNEFYPEMTDSLREAVDWFVLSCAARIARGQRESHMSMLVHTTLYTDVHGRFKDPVELEINRLTSVLRPGHKVRDELQALWDRESALVPAQEMGESPLTWGQVTQHLEEVFNEIGVIIDNGQSDNRLSYEGQRSIQIVIGGNTLSRGLTLEGLMVSFFLRASTTYDTLLQMGRWFGYRIGYSDLPRIWMTADLQENFRHLARVEAEIRTDIARYERENCTPRDFGVNIQAHSTLAITSRMKMQHAILAKMSFNKAVKQTTYFQHRDEAWLRANHEAARTLLKQSHRGVAPTRIWDRHWLYAGVDVRDILDFFEGYHVHEKHQDMQTALLGAYTRAQQESGNLLQWNVAVIGQKSGTPFDDLLPEGLSINFINRSRLAGDGDADLKAIMSQTDRAVDFDLEKAPPVNRFKTWAVESGFYSAEPQAGFVDWCADYRSPIDDQPVDDHTGLRRPLLLLYPIDPTSKPAYRNQKKVSRQPRCGPQCRPPGGRTRRDLSPVQAPARPRLLDGQPVRRGARTGRAGGRRRMRRALKLDFEFLETQPSSGDMRSMAVEAAITPNGPIVLAIDSDEHRHLLIPLEHGATVHPDRKSAGIQIGGHQLLQDGQLRRFVDVHCRMPHLHDVFELIADEILDRVLADPDTPDRKAGEVLNRWRELLGRERGTAPSVELLAGLWGELWHLRELARLGLQSLACWTGPGGSVHDFESDVAALEVKATTAREGWRLKINGVEQLDITRGRALHLSAVKLEQAPGESVPDLLDDLITLGMDRYDLAAQLDKAGLPVAQLEQVRSVQFRLVEHRSWKVEGSFPRIISSTFPGSQLPLGVAAIDYVLDLTAWQGPHLTTDEWNELVRVWATR